MICILLDREQATSLCFVYIDSANNEGPKEMSISSKRYTSESRAEAIHQMTERGVTDPGSFPSFVGQYVLFERMVQMD